MTQYQLVVRAMFDELFMAQRAMLLRTLRRMVGNHGAAEDLLQETYLRVSAALTERTVEHLLPFMFQTARNLAFDHLRGLQRQSRLIQTNVSSEFIEQIPAAACLPEAQLEQQQLLEALDTAISGLTQRQQQVFVLDRLHGWSQAEIAAHLEVSLSTVQKDLKLAMAVCLAVQRRLELR